MTVRRFDSREAWLEAAAGDFIEALRGFDSAAARTGRFEACLAGGATPEALYRKLAALPLRAPIRLWFGDERWLPRSFPDRNEAMAARAFASCAWSPAPEPVPWPASDECGSPEESAEKYTKRTIAEFGGMPAFDYVWLGVGADGHTASLFSAADAERREIAFATTAPSGFRARTTFGAEAFRSAGRLAFLALGPEKAGVVERLAEGDRSLFASAAVSDRAVVFFAD